MDIKSLFFNDSINFKFLYDIPYIKQVIAFFLIPLLVFIIICSIILLAYSNKGEKDIKYKYKANVFSIIISILLTVVFLSILLGFSYAFYKQMTAVGLKTPLAYLVIASPIVPFIFLISFFIKLIKVMKKKPTGNTEIINETSEKEQPTAKEETQTSITEEELIEAFKKEPFVVEISDDNVNSINDNREETATDKSKESDIESILADIDNINDIDNTNASDEIEETETLLEPEFGKHEETGKHEKIEYGKHEEARVDELDDILTDIEEQNKDEEIELL